MVENRTDSYGVRILAVRSWALLGWRTPVRDKEGGEAPRCWARPIAGSSSLLSVAAQARPSSQMWIPLMLPAPPALPPPASPTTPGELPEGVFYSFARDSGPQPGHSLLLDADLSCTSRSSVTESALDSLFQSTRVKLRLL